MSVIREITVPKRDVDIGELSVIREMAVIGEMFVSEICLY